MQNELVLTYKIKSEDRLYPDSIPCLDGEPLREVFEVVNDQKFGKCIKSKVSFTRGQFVAMIHSKIILNSPNLHSAQISINEHIYDPWFAGLITHSCEPNLMFDTKLPGFYAVKDIKPGDILTQDYELTEDNLYQKFLCDCGTVTCRGKIQGRKFK
jgi:tyrocidine synthetase-3